MAAGLGEGLDTGGLTEGELAEHISELGIRPESIEIYLHLLRQDDLSVDGLAGATGRSRDCVRMALDDLVRHAMVVRSGHDLDVVHIVPPRLPLLRLLNESQARIRSAEAQLDRARQAAEMLVEMTDDLARSEVERMEVIRGRYAVGDRLGELLHAAQREVSTMVTWQPGPGAAEHARPGDAALLERGVTVRLLALEGELRGSPSYLSELEELGSLGAQIALAPSLPTRMILIDGSVAVLPHDEGRPSEAAVVLRHPVLIKLLCQLFDTIWDSSRPFGAPEAHDTVNWRPDPLEREVIKLLAAGHKDEAVARRVGMSLRSVRRLISGIAATLGTDSRFELGVRCCEHELTGSANGTDRRHAVVGPPGPH